MAVTLQWLIAQWREQFRAWDDNDAMGYDSLIDLAHAANRLFESLLVERPPPQEAPPMRCQGCGGPHHFDTSVPSVRWNAVIRANDLPEFLCLTCIVRAFACAGQSFTAQLWSEEFGGLPVMFLIGNNPLIDAVLINEENTKLRARVRELETLSPKPLGSPTP